MTLRKQLLPFLDPERGLAEPAVDWLQEQGVPLTELLRAYAGLPPAWLGTTWQEDEGLRELLALWCQWAEPKTLSTRFVGEGDQRRILYRFEAVRACGLDWQALCREAGFYIEHPPGGVPPAEHDRFARLCLEQLAGVAARSDNPGVRFVVESEARVVRRFIDWARRGQKRRVLALFPEVRWKTRCCFQADEAGNLALPLPALLCEAGMNPDRLCESDVDREHRQVIVTQVLAAPEWIGPEPSPHWGQSHLPPLGEILRRARELIPATLDPRFLIRDR